MTKSDRRCLPAKNWRHRVFRLFLVSNLANIFSTHFGLFSLSLKVGLGPTNKSLTLASCALPLSRPVRTISWLVPGFSRWVIRAQIAVACAIAVSLCCSSCHPPAAVVFSALIRAAGESGFNSGPSHQPIFHSFGSGTFPDSHCSPRKNKTRPRTPLSCFHPPNPLAGDA